jgi:hypothetical protein
MIVPGHAQTTRALQFHLAELDGTDVLNAMLPGLGHDWTEILGGSQTALYYSLCVYANEWEAVAARWAREDFTMLQPTTPCWVIPAVHANNALKKKIAQKELEMCVISSAAPIPCALEYFIGGCFVHYYSDM